MPSSSKSFQRSKSLLFKSPMVCSLISGDPWWPWCDAKKVNKKKETHDFSWNHIGHSGGSSMSSEKDRSWFCRASERLPCCFVESHDQQLVAANPPFDHRVWSMFGSEPAKTSVWRILKMGYPIPSIALSIFIIFVSPKIDMSWVLIHNPLFRLTQIYPDIILLARPWTPQHFPFLSSMIRRFGWSSKSPRPPTDSRSQSLRLDSHEFSLLSYLTIPI